LGFVFTFAAPIHYLINYLSLKLAHLFCPNTYHTLQKMKIAIINYDAGNIRSVIFALERLGVQPILTADADIIRSADKVIFPGQGEASSAMRSLRERNLDKLIPDLKQPFLGVCVGMQLLCAHSEENDTPCLGVIPQKVVKFPTGKGIKVPQVGWNRLNIVSQNNQSTIINNQFQDEWFYFVHSYYVETGEFTTATANYGGEFSACLRKDNFHAAQFHPEKSSKAGQHSEFFRYLTYNVQRNVIPLF
jgi:imidazole glycerol-phosphate synthase subunit HisH